MTEEIFLKTLTEMRIGQRLTINKSVYERVPGGWVYSSKVGIVFIPFSMDLLKDTNQ